jgi:hypothetical protein
LKLANHLHAELYPLWFLYEEHRLLSVVKNQEEAMRAVLIQCAVSSILDKKANKEFQKLIKRMTEGG